MADSIKPYYDPILDKIRSIDQDSDGLATYDPFLEQLRMKDKGDGFVVDALLGKIRLGSKLNLNEPEVDVYIDGLTTPLSVGQITKLNKFVKDLKSGLEISNLSDAFDVIRIHANETAESALRNIVKRANDATAVNSPTFTAFEGFAGNGTSSRISSNYTPSSDAINYQQNNASILFYLRTNNKNSLTVFGVNDGSNKWVYFNFGVINYSRINDNSSANTITVPDTLGMFALIRSGASQGRIIRNKSVNATFTITSTGLPTKQVFELCYNNNGTGSEYDIKQNAFICYGRAFSDTEIAIITDAFEAYMDSNGKGVIA